jgi:hypothetical protein
VHSGRGHKLSLTCFATKRTRFLRARRTRLCDQPQPGPTRA